MGCQLDGHTAQADSVNKKICLRSENIIKGDTCLGREEPKYIQYKSGGCELKVITEPYHPSDSNPSHDLWFLSGSFSFPRPKPRHAVTAMTETSWIHRDRKLVQYNTPPPPEALHLHFSSSPFLALTFTWSFLLRAHAETRGRTTGTTCELSGKLGVLLGDLDLCPCGLGVGKGVDDLTLGASELGSALEVLEGTGDVVLLEEELGHGGNSNIALGVDCAGQVSQCTGGWAVRELTNESLLAELLSLLEVLLPLEEGKSLVDEGKHVHSHRLRLLLHLHCGVELLNSLREVALVEQQLTVVVVHIRHLGKVLNASSEGGHGRGDGSHLVLGHAELNVREDEVLVKLDRLLVVLLGVGKVTLDEVCLGAVVVDVRVLRVLLECLGKLSVSLVGLTKLKANAGAFDVALRHVGVELDALVEVLGRCGVVAEKCSDCSSHVVGKSFVLAKITELESLVEGLAGFLISITGSLLQALKTALQLTDTSLLIELDRVLKT